MDAGRRAHYSDFYDHPPAGPVALVWGNCQAESVRVLLSGSPTFPLPIVRVPPVFELGPADMGPLAALLPHVSILLSQPVRSGYRGLPIGTDDLVPSLRPHARVLRWPVVRYVGLHPYAAIVRHPADPSADPPIVPYHDLRTLSCAAGRRPGPTPSADVFRAIASASVGELERREHLGTAVGVSDLLMPLGPTAVHTLNHPGNELLISLARRIQAALGLAADASDPGRELLGRLSAPLEPAVVSALALGTDPTEQWTVDGTGVSPAKIHDAQLRWYRHNPACVEAGLRRHAERMTLLEL